MSCSAVYSTDDVFSPQNQGGDDEVDSDADPVTGKATGIVLVDTNDLTWDAGIYFEPPPPVYNLGDYVWNDLNKNGIQDEGEPGVQGITVELFDTADCSDTSIDSTSTNGSGLYAFSGLPQEHTVSCSAVFPLAGLSVRRIRVVMM